jgi:hypothetical protein
MKWCLIVVLLVLFGALPVLARDNCFPGNRHALFSPSHNYQLTWKKGSRDSQGVEAHHLLFSRKGEKERKDFFEFYNQACVNWSPDEKYFSVSHLVGSNIAENFIFESADISHRVDAKDLLPEKTRNYFGKGIVHGYIETTAWNKDGLFIRAWGDREDEQRKRADFDVTLRCTVNQSNWTCKTANQ